MNNQEVIKALRESANQMQALCEGVMPLRKSADEAYRNDVQSFLKKSQNEQRDIIEKANDLFHGVQEIAKVSEIAEKNEIPLGAVLFHKSSADITDYLTHKKTSFWGETGFLRPEYRAVVSSIDAFASAASFDTGYQFALRTVDAREKVSFEVGDFVRNYEYYQLESDVTEIPLSGARTGAATYLSPNRYGVGTQVAKWLEGKTIGSSMTEIMADIRITSAQGKAKAAYQAILKKCTKTANNYKCQALYSDRIDNIIANINYVANELKKQAIGAEDATAAGLPITAATPIVVYYHPDWQSTVDFIERRRVQVSGVLDQIMPNSELIFVPSYLQAKSGAWEHTGTDRLGFAKQKEAGSPSQMGVKVVIPKIANMLIIAQDLFFAQDMMGSDFTNKVRCEERYLGYMDDRQHAWAIVDGNLKA